MSTMGYVTTLQGADDATTLDLAFDSDKYKVNGATTPFNSAVTFTRSSAGGVWDDQGKYVMQTSDVPRFDYNPVTLALRGILVEEQRSNLLLRTNLDRMFEVESDISYQTELIRFVDGITPFRKLVEGWGTLSKTAQTSGVPYTAGVTCTFSCFAKTAGRRLHVGLPENVTATWNLTDGSFITSGGGIANATNLGNGVWRVSLTFTPTVSITSNRIVLRLANDSNSIKYQGDGESGVYVGGIQVEGGAVATSYIPSTDTFSSRSTTATYFDANKVLKVAAINEARDKAYDWTDKGEWKPVGLLSERASTNLALQSNSETLFQARVGASYTDTGQLFVDSVTPLRKLAESAGGSSHRGVISGWTIPANSTYTVSFVVKKDERSDVRIADSAGNSADYDLLALTATKDKTSGLYSAKIRPFGDGFVRISMTGTTGATDLTNTIAVFLMKGPGTATYAGESGYGLFIGGCQVEVGASASSYIPTTTAQVTRGGDAIASTPTTRAGDIVTVNNFNTWYNQSEGTVCVEATPIGVPSGVYASFDNGVPNESLRLDSQATGNRLIVISQGTTQASIVSTPAPVAGVNQRMVASYKANSFDLFSGGSVVSDTSGLVPTVTRLRLMDAGVTGQPNAHIKSLKYWPFKLAGQQLQIV